MAAALDGRPGALVSRLLSPRLLAPSTAYRAFLVPTFLRGVKAGQGEDPGTIDGLAPAWPQTGDTVLPVYHSWRFQTGTVGSFKEAARQLRPTPDLPPTVGARAMEISQPGFSLTSPTGGAQVDMGGALQTTTQAGAVDLVLTDAWRDGLGDFIDLGNLSTQTLRVVAPPLYGRWYAAEETLDRPLHPTPTNPPWFKLLNSDPRYRVAAGLGTEVVQRDQQAMLVAALEQTSRIVDNVNRVRKVMQTGRDVFTRLIARHLPATATGSNFLITSFLHGKVLNCAGGTPQPDDRRLHERDAILRTRARLAAAVPR